jgi:hypothetical protein
MRKHVACGIAHGIALAALFAAGVALGMHSQVKADRAVVETAQQNEMQAAGLEEECKAKLSLQSISEVTGR